MQNHDTLPCVLVNISDVDYETGDAEQTTARVQLADDLDLCTTVIAFMGSAYVEDASREDVTIKLRTWAMEAQPGDYIYNNQVTLIRSPSHSVGQSLMRDELRQLQTRKYTIVREAVTIETN